VASCSGIQNKKKSSAKEEKYRSIAIEKYHSNVQYLFNESRSHVICLKFSKPTPNKPHPELSFFIYEVSADKILHEDSSMNAEVNWLTNSHVQVEFIPEIISEDENLPKTGYVYDVDKQEKRPFNSFK
jgi:hypothetical protein